VRSSSFPGFSLTPPLSVLPLLQKKKKRQPRRNCGRAGDNPASQPNPKKKDDDRSDPDPAYKMSGRNAAKYDRMQGRSNYPREFQTQLITAPCASPLYCCYATFCCWCASFQQRKQLLYGDLSRYICCAGACPCSGRMGEQKCPELCLAMESSLCFPQSVASTRYALQDELRIQNTPFDNCVIGTMIAAAYLSCVCSIAACISGSDEVRSQVA
jgi:hypothetical protein